MTEYRLFFLDHKGAIEARQEFDVASDDLAIALGSLVFEACSDIYNGYELWSLDRRVLSATRGVGAIAQRALQDATRDTQESVLEVEEAIRRSHWRVAKSRKLLDALETLRAAVGRSPRA